MIISNIYRGFRRREIYVILTTKILPNLKMRKKTEKLTAS